MRRLIAILSLLLLASCAKPDVITQYKYIEVSKPPNPRQLQLVSPYFYVVSDANITEFLDTIKKENDGVFFAVTPRDYEIMAENWQEFRRYMRETRAIIEYYETLLSTDQPNPEE